MGYKLIDLIRTDEELSTILDDEEFVIEKNLFLDLKRRDISEEIKKSIYDYFLICTRLDKNIIDKIPIRLSKIVDDFNVLPKFQEYIYQLLCNNFSDEHFKLKKNIINGFLDICGYEFKNNDEYFMFTKEVVFKILVELRCFLNDFL